MAKAIPELSLDTQTLQQMLRELEIGEMISYHELSAAIGRDVQEEGYGNLRSATRRLLKADRMVFEAVRGEGIKRLDDRGKVSAGRSHVRRAHTQAKLARSKTSAVDNFDGLPNELKVEHNIVLAQAGTIAHVTSTRMQRKIEGRVTEPQKSFSPKKSFQLMKDI